MLRELLTSLVLLTPCEYTHDRVWVGLESHRLSTPSGYAVKIVIWPRSLVVEVGRWNTLLASKALW